MPHTNPRRDFFVELVQALLLGAGEGAHGFDSVIEFFNDGGRKFIFRLRCLFFADAERGRVEVVELFRVGANSLITFETYTLQN